MIDTEVSDERSAVGTGVWVREGSVCSGICVDIRAPFAFQPHPVLLELRNFVFELRGYCYWDTYIPTSDPFPYSYISLILKKGPNKIKDAILNISIIR